MYINVNKIMLPAAVARQLMLLLSMAFLKLCYQYTIKSVTMTAAVIEDWGLCW